MAGTRVSEATHSHAEDVVNTAISLNESVDMEKGLRESTDLNNQPLITAALCAQERAMLGMDAFLKTL